MNCPTCHKKSTTRSAELKCEHCDYVFSIDPSLGLLWSDKSFMDLVEHVSSANKYFFTVSGLQFRSLINDKGPKRNLVLATIVSSLLIILIGPWFSWGFLPWWLTFILVFIPFTFYALNNTHFNSRTRCKDLFAVRRAWKESGKIIDRWVDEVEISGLSSLSDRLNADKLVVVDDELTLAWLYKNGFTENRSFAIITFNEFSDPMVEQKSFSESFDACFKESLKCEKSNSEIFRVGPTAHNLEQIKQKVKWDSDDIYMHAFPFPFIQRALEESMANRASLQLTTEVE